MNCSALQKRNGAALLFPLPMAAATRRTSGIAVIQIAPPGWPIHGASKKRGHRCPSCAGNRRLGLEGLRIWGASVGLELVDAEYHGTNYAYNWRCKQAQHPIRRCKGDIEESLEKGYLACSKCGPGIAGAFVVGFLQPWP